MRVARWSATHPWRAIGLWLLLVVVAVGMSVVIPKQQAENKDTWVGQSGQAAAFTRRFVRSARTHGQ